MHDEVTAPADVVGILLAAGRGRRMGQTKQLMPWPPDSASGTVVEAAFDCIATHCTSMIVVTGHDAEAVAHALRPRAFEQVRSDPDVDLMKSIALGLQHAQHVAPQHHVVLPPQTIVLTVVPANGTWLSFTLSRKKYGPFPNGSAARSASGRTRSRASARTVPVFISRPIKNCLFGLPTQRAPMPDRA